MHLLLELASTQRDPSVQHLHTPCLRERRLWLLLVLCDTSHKVARSLEVRARKHIPTQTPEKNAACEIGGIVEVAWRWRVM